MEGVGILGHKEGSVRNEVVLRRGLLESSLGSQKCLLLKELFHPSSGVELGHETTKSLNLVVNRRTRSKDC